MERSDATYNILLGREITSVPSLGIIDWRRMIEIAQEWLAEFDLPPSLARPVHHALLPEGDETSALWDDVVSDQALGRAPDVWYYGHYHAAAVYSEHSAAGPDTKVRVMGHGAIPFAAPAELADNAGPGKPIACYAHTPYDDEVPEHRGRAMNGFAVVTLSRDGGIRERFYNQDGSDMCG